MLEFPGGFIGREGAERKIMAKCARCDGEIKEGQRYAPDPCCGAPDCDSLGDYSHFDCLPTELKAIEEDYDYEGVMVLETYPED